MIFIKLTLQTNGKSVFVNAEKIIDLFVYEEGKGTAISLNLDVSYHVQESPEEIIEKIRAEEERQNTLIVGEDITNEAYIREFRLEGDVLNMLSKPEKPPKEIVDMFDGAAAEEFEKKLSFLINTT